MVSFPFFSLFLFLGPPHVLSICNLDIQLVSTVSIPFCPSIPLFSSLLRLFFFLAFSTLQSKKLLCITVKYLLYVDFLPFRVPFYNSPPPPRSHLARLSTAPFYEIPQDVSCIHLPLQLLSAQPRPD